MFYRAGKSGYWKQKTISSMSLPYAYKYKVDKNLLLNGNNNAELHYPSALLIGYQFICIYITMLYQSPIYIKTKLSP